MVDFVLRHGNDLLAVESLRGFEVSQQIQQVNSGAQGPAQLSFAFSRTGAGAWE